MRATSSPPTSSTSSAPSARRSRRSTGTWTSRRCAHRCRRSRWSRWGRCGSGWCTSRGRSPAGSSGSSRGSPAAPRSSTGTRTCRRWSSTTGCGSSTRARRPSGASRRSGPCSSWTFPDGNWLHASCSSALDRPNMCSLVWRTHVRESPHHGRRRAARLERLRALLAGARGTAGGHGEALRDALVDCSRPLCGRHARRGPADPAGQPPAGRRHHRRRAPRLAVAARGAAARLRGGMDLDVVFLGTSASTPTASRAPASLLVRRGGERLLFDCAEGTQRQLMRSTLGLPDLEEIFLTHYHADHTLGLPGMLKTFSLRQRETPLTVYGPPGLRELFGDLRRIVGRLGYPVELVELRPGETLDRDEYRILVMPVHHGVSAVGYVIAEEDRPGRFDVAAADALGIPSGPLRGALQRGESVTLDDGTVVTPADVLGDARRGRRIVLTGDTAPTESVQVLAEGADVLVHEA